MREVDVGALPGGAWQVSLDGTTIAATAALARDGTLTAALGPRRLTSTVVASGDKRHVFVAGRDHVLSHVDLLGIAGAEHDEEGAGLLAPMPGKVIALLAKPGAAVDKGAPLLVLEAMKMEHTISAPRAGTVKGLSLCRRRPGRRRRRAGRVRLRAGGRQGGSRYGARRLRRAAPPSRSARPRSPRTAR
jgi:3-methylcrotonyl-CoA carboxylase alpha subunit